MTAPIVTPEQAAEELLRRREAAKSLHGFIKEAWPQIEPGYKLKDGWALQAICEHAEALYRGEIKRLLVNIPPRSLKTISFSVALPAWSWLDNPSTKYLYGSYSFDLAKDASIKCRRLIKSRWFQTRWGDRFDLEEDRDRTDYFANTKGGERIITATDATTTGRGGDIIILDDPNNVKDSSDVALDNALKFFREVIPTRYNDQTTGRMLVVQQRTHENDISGYILRELKEDFTTLILPLEYEPNRHCTTIVLPSTYPLKWQDPRKKKNDSLSPDQFPAAAIARLRRTLGTYGTAGQLQQRPAPEAGGMIKKNWFQIWKSAEPPKLEFTVLSFDTAMSERKDAAFSAATTWGVFKDEHAQPNVILLSTWREHCEYPELRERVKRMAADYLDDKEEEPKLRVTTRKPDLILIEAKASGISIIQDMRRSGVLVTPFNPDKLGDKKQRVRVITPLMENKRIWVPGSIASKFKDPRPFAEEFIEQCISFPNAASRDLVDTMSQAFWRLMSSGFVWRTDEPGPGEPADNSSKPAFY